MDFFRAKIKNKMMKYFFGLFLTIFISAEAKTQSSADSSCRESRMKSAEMFQKSISQKQNQEAHFLYDISYHRLEFEIDPAVLYIRGAITTYFAPTRPDFTEMSFDLSSALTVDSVVYHTKKLAFYRPKELLNIVFTNTLPENVMDSLTVYYQGQPPSTGFGSFQKSTHNDIPIIWTLSEPFGAKDWWACKQSLNDKADSVDMFVTTPIGNKVAGNGILASEKILNDKKVTHWKHRHPIAAYLIAFSVTNYSQYSDYAAISPTDSLQILNYVYPETLSDAQNSTPNLIPIMELFNRLYGIYPFADEKYGHAQFGRGGGMEHQTMTFISHFNTLLMAHELAHQWFGDDITCGSWHDIWLNEGFATYSEGLVVEHGLSNNGQNFKEWKAGRISAITQKDDGAVYVVDTSSVSRIFDSRLSYSKGAMVLHTLRRQLGDSAFFAGIKSYRADIKLSGNYARTNDLKKHFEVASGSNLDTFFSQWIYGEGFPIYQLSFSQIIENRATLTINQKQSTDKATFFPLKIPVLFVGYENDTTIIFDNTFSGQKFVTQINFKVLNIVFDPEHDIISKGTKYFYENSLLSDQIVLIPNPTQNDITFILPAALEIKKIEIIDLSGKSLRKLTPNFYGERYTLDVSFLKTGSYFIQIADSKTLITKKFIKN